MLSNMLESLKKTTREFSVNVIAVIDEDVESRDIALEFGCFVNFSKTKRGALNCWNLALQASGDILIAAGDDQIFHEGWLEYALESHNKKLVGYGVVGMNDLAYNGNTQVSTMFLFDRKYCIEHMGGIFAPPMYKYYCVDSEWNEKARMLGRFYWDERSVVEHLHSAHGKREHDAHDEEKEVAGWMEIDNKTFEERKARGFPITWESLI
jgi:hypothetical protein